MSLAEQLESVLIETAENNNFTALKTQLESIKSEDVTPSVKKCLNEGASLAFEGASVSSVDALDSASLVCSL